MNEKIFVFGRKKQQKVIEKVYRWLKRKKFDVTSNFLHLKMKNKLN